MQMLFIPSPLSRIWCFLRHIYHHVFLISERISLFVTRASRKLINWACQKVGEDWQRNFPKSEYRISEEFARELCNEHFRLVSHLEKLEKMPDPPRPVRRLRTTAEYLKQTFARQGIEYYDLTGQDYHEGRLDFESISAAEIDPTLTHAKIVICEHPAVFLHGNLIQTARGIVARPQDIEL